MSHFTVMVRITREQIAKHGSAESALEALLAPYQENNMGDCPKQYMKFEDVEDEYREDFETGSTEMIRCEDGTLAYETDERFRVPGEVGVGTGTHKAPSHLKRVQVPHKQRFETFDRFMSEWHGYKKDPELGRFGRWENPNRKWDWWQLGGRWTGFFPLKAGRAQELGSPGLMTPMPKKNHGDLVALDDIDLDTVAAQQHEAAEKFWGEWKRLIAGEKLDSLFGPRSTALNIGLLSVRQGSPEPGEERRAIPWAGKVPVSDSRHGWHDVWLDITKEEFLAKYEPEFSPINTYAFLDESSWHEPGRMGWWACSSATPESREEHLKSFAEWFKATPGDALLAIVDCHI